MKPRIFVNASEKRSRTHRVLGMQLMAPIIIVCLTVVPARVQTTAQLSPETINRVETEISTEMARQKIPGLSIAVATDHRIRYANGFGVADLENSVPAMASTVYRTASIAKPMTATAVMQLAERDKLDLDAPIQKYCAAFPEKRWPVTTRQLLAHLGGVRHYKSGEESTGTQHYFTIADALKLFKDEPLLYEPDTRFQYSTFGYNLLGCAIEGASGMMYEDYMCENVFRPAGMHATQSDNTFMVIPNRARGYFVLDEQTYDQLPEAAKRQAKVGAVYNARLHDTSMKIPGGGLVSTAIDLVRFAIAVQNGTFIKPETLQQMWTSAKTRDGKELDYGLGWGLGTYHEYKLVSHSGGQAGVSTNLALLPEKGLIIGVMANLEGIDVSRITRRVGEVLLKPGR